MTLRDYKLLIALLISVYTYGQHTVNGVVLFSKTQQPVANVKIYDKVSGEVATTNAKGAFEFETKKTKMTLVFFSFEYEVKELNINTQDSTPLKVILKDLSTALTEVEITARKRKVFELKRLKDVEGTAIYAGKKTEVVLVEQSLANLAANNARQIYSQVAGLNIYENDDAGLQLNIGGRGLDPNRTSNFNTRQSGYDISADVLGYPESYYAPAAEALEEIQIIRGAASLQYGTQFGGLVNFKLKRPNPKKALEFINRNTVGRFGLFTNFVSLSGTKNKFSYYTYYNYKRGDGFRPNSGFESQNVFAHLGYQFNKKTSLEAEVTYLDYLAQQGGGLSDDAFEENPFQSNRARNWFKVDWFLYNLKLTHQFSKRTSFTFNAFGLNASREAVGFRIRRVDLPDPGGARELLASDFNNFGFEGRVLSSYKLLGKKATYLLGGKYYNSDNFDFQGPGSDGADPNFKSAEERFPNFPVQGNFFNPNENVAVFGEHILYLSDKLSITPGARFEYINTGSTGTSRRVNFDGAGNPIGDQEVLFDAVNERSFVLLGIGASYKPNAALEVYANASENYRSITFSDVNIVNPSNGIDPDIEDETGFTLDLGLRGNWNNWLSYDVGAFGLFYNKRIGFLTTQIPPLGNVGQLRTNIGDARIIGVESLFDFNLKAILNLKGAYSFNGFINTSFINSEYTAVEEGVSGILGNQVEFVPNVNLKTGLRFGYKNFNSSLQYTYLAEQFTDAENSIDNDVSGIVGTIPSYDVLDITASYTYKQFKLETGINNLLDNTYFTRRATGYPGPGIIPSSPRSWYATLQIKF